MKNPCVGCPESKVVGDNPHYCTGVGSCKPSDIYQAVQEAISANNKKWIEKIERLLIIFKPQTFCPYTLSAVSYSIECTDCHTRDVELEHCFIHAWQQLKKDMEVSQ